MEKKVSVICIDCEPCIIDKVLIEQTYCNLEVVEVKTGNEFIEDILQYMETVNSEYICFLEDGNYYLPKKIEYMVEYLEKNDKIGVMFCGRNHVDSYGEVLAHTDAAYVDDLNENIFRGEQVVKVCVQNGNNLYGTLSCVMLNKKRLHLNKKISRYKDEEPYIQKMLLMFNFMIGEAIKIDPMPLVKTRVSKYDENILKKQIKSFRKNIFDFLNENNLYVKNEEIFGICKENYNILMRNEMIYSDVKKDITLFYQDKGEYYNLLPIKAEAIRRGYTVHESDRLDDLAEIGIYCQHFGKPQNSKFSLVLLHDMAQGHNRWPNIWELERWNVYNIGILPGKMWGNRWKKCGFNYYANSKNGVYTFGYPKSDLVYDEDIIKKVQKLRKKFNMKDKISILYAPSWENDEKEDDFVRALASLDVNLLIKQAHWPKEYESVNSNIKKMRKLHEGRYENVFYIEPEESIQVALEMCDIVVSEESSVMTEALIYNKPSIAVIDWLIPDTNPSRVASVPFDYVCKCKKVELREKIEKILENPKNIDIKEKCNDFFLNKGKVNSLIMDAIDYYIGESNDEKFKRCRLVSEYMPITLWS